MTWDEILKTLKNQPVIEPLMLANDPKDLLKIRVQLSRWVKSGRLIKIRNGIYTLSDSYRTTPVNNEYVAVFANRPSYISLEYALSAYGLIPEYVPNITLVTTKRPGTLKFSGGMYIYRHIMSKLFWGYLAKGEKNFATFYAEPEKALLDLFYFTKGELTIDYMEAMRFQNTATIDQDKLMSYAERFRHPRIIKAAAVFRQYASNEKGMKEL
jgi:predicted transcriptional regulator of viral defense system